MEDVSTITGSEYSVHPESILHTLPSTESRGSERGFSNLSARLVSYHSNIQ